ncbi:TM2 domain-containing protein CG10795-like [Saccostrea echinata]|uniref:TM2 domain-containing protein CG10795-like n=1 Tax=Saccostrea echinata TaxID=191078 RepID=UPI002A7F26C1|nr:TM2 domain-containing protein CG10795-like [Saccostrea echinata]
MYFLPHVRWNFVMYTVISCFILHYEYSTANDLKCEDLLMGQYYCKEPLIDAETQAEVNCDPESKTTPTECIIAEGIKCIPQHSGTPYTFNGTEVGFSRPVPCRWTNGYNFETALLLSVFLGMFGVDRFYLGYPAIGLLKFSTLGFFFLGQLIDILLIALQVVKPSDGSDYIMNYFGVGLTRIQTDNDTYIKPDESWNLS